MTDIEIVSACAEVMGIEVYEFNGKLYYRGGVTGHPILYNPLHNKSQAMDLLLSLHIEIQWGRSGIIYAQRRGNRSFVSNTDPLRAICECAAKLKEAN